MANFVVRDGVGVAHGWFHFMFTAEKTAIAVSLTHKKARVFQIKDGKCLRDYEYGKRIDG